MTVKGLVAGAVAVSAVATAVAANLPDLKRYLKIRSM
jgi:hypothetical protein